MSIDFCLIPNLQVPVLEDLNAKLQKRSADIQLRGTRKYANSFDRMHRQFLLTLKKSRATFSPFLLMLPRKSVQVSASKISFSMLINLFEQGKLNAIISYYTVARPILFHSP